MIQQSRTFASPRSLEEFEEPPIVKTAHPRPQQAKPYVAPRNEVEQIIADVWQELLGIEQVSIHDNFFELGGDSVISLQINAKANQAGIRFTNKDIFEHQTIAELAEVAGKSQINQVENGNTCQQTLEARGYTPSDFPGAKLSQKDLDKFIDGISKPSGRRTK
jgi:acyl carrier protein